VTRTITFDIIRELGSEPRLSVQVDGRHIGLASLAPEDVGPWIQGFIAALPPLEE
jgi:hypothetical protein